MSQLLHANDEAVDQHVQRMSLRQKLGQIVQTERMVISPEEVEEHCIGSVLSGGGSWPGNNRVEDWVAMNEAYWQASMRAGGGKLGIPIIYGVDAVHGHNNVQGATMFPHNIGLGAANDVPLLAKIAKATAREILATGVDWTFAPTLAVSRDAHWGRMYESYSETPEIVSAYAGVFVDGLQGDLGTNGVAACAKHWVGDGGTNFGVDQGETTLSWKELRDMHIAPYRAALEAGVLSVMVSFSSWNSDKCHGHNFLVNDYLKSELGFEGVVISDWDGIEYLSEDPAEAIALSVNAGIDVYMVSEKWLEFIDTLEGLVNKGIVPIERIDDAVARMLRLKYALGLFDKPSPKARKWSHSDDFGSAAHRAIAREAVRKSLVMLKNEAQTLPLDRGGRLLVAGKSAHNIANQCGGFTVGWQGVPEEEGLSGATTIWQGIQALAPNAQLSLDPEGSDLDASDFDAAIVVVGETPYAEGLGDIREGDDAVVQTGSQVKGLMKVMEPYGGSLELRKLHPEDLACINALAAHDIPIVVIVLSGRPLIINEEFSAADALVAGWLPGSEGSGVADVLFGDFDFNGRLSFSWLKDEQGTGHQRREESILFPCGFGLNYQSS